MLAAVKNHAGLAEQLLARGADVNAADVYGWTPLLRAVYEKRPAVVRVLLRDASIDVNARNELGATALHYAAALGDPEMVRSLLHKGADADARDVGDRTPLTMAIEQGKVEVVRILSER
jgi:ankyrin repeat protein